MIINQRPTKAKSEHYVCPHHKKHPEDRSYAGCTCHSVYWNEIDEEAEKELEELKNRFKDAWEELGE